MHISDPKARLRQLKPINNLNLFAHRTSLTEKFDISKLIHQPVKLKLYAVLRDQQKGTNPLSHFQVYRPIRLDSEFEDKGLMKELFNWTDDAAKIDGLDVEIIVRDKFSITASTNNTPRALNQPISFDQDKGLRSNHISFDQLIKSKYEAYKQNFDKKTSSRDLNKKNGHCEHKSSIFANRARVYSYESSDEDIKVPVISDVTYMNNNKGAQRKNSDLADNKKIGALNYGKVNVSFKNKEAISKIEDENNSGCVNIQETHILRLKHSLDKWVKIN